MFRLFERVIPPFPEAPIEQPPAKLWAFTWHYTKPFRGLLICLLCTAVMIAVIEVYMFQAIGEMIDWMQSSQPGDFFSAHGGTLAFIFFVILVLWPGLSFLDSALEHQGLLGNFAMQVRWRAHRYLLRQSPSFFANDFAGRLATKLMQTALSVRDSVVTLSSLVVYVAVYFSSALLIFIGSDLSLAAPLVCWFFAYMTVLWYFLPRLQAVSAAQSEARSQMTGRVVDAYTNIQTVKMFSTFDSEEAYAKEGMQDMLQSVYRQMRYVTVLYTLLVVLNAFLVCGTLFLGLWLWKEGVVTTGAVAVAGALTLRIQSMSQWFIWELASLFEAIGTTQDGLNTIAQPIEVKDTSARELNVRTGGIEFRNVSFAYAGADHVIENFDLKISPGERVGLVGKSGAGKSTLVNLLLRMYDLQVGEILIDGQNIVKVSQESLRSNIAMVTQDTSLLHRTISENIAYGSPNASREEIQHAARMAKALDFIGDLSDHEGNRGFDAKVGERGVKLSGGQRQRIAIARVILKNAPILILDEATSALDSEVEAAIQEQLDMLMAGKTVVAIAHRLSTIAEMDKLIVLDKGKISESGTHQQLLANKGVYAKLWARQSGGFIGTDQVPVDEAVY
ncbi:MAG: ABC transporter ATP-binding protein [Pseudomonadota bacterium]